MGQAAAVAWRAGRQEERHPSAARGPQGDTHRAAEPAAARSPLSETPWTGWAQAAMLVSNFFLNSLPESRTSGAVLLIKGLLMCSLRGGIQPTCMLKAAAFSLEDTDEEAVVFLSCAGVASAASASDDDLFKDPTWKDPQLELGGLSSFTPQTSGAHPFSAVLQFAFHEALDASVRHWPKRFSLLACALTCALAACVGWCCCWASLGTLPELHHGFEHVPAAVVV